jgi:2-phosphoglycerate kinase
VTLNVNTTVFLVGGPPGGGKTTLARHLGHRLDFASLTIDELRTASLALTTTETHPDLHRVGLPNHIKYFTHTSPAEMVSDALAQHVALWPAIRSVIRKHARWGPGIIIDGWHLIPEKVAELDASNIVAVWLDVDRSILEERERAVWDFYATSDDPDRMFANFLARSVRWNDLISQQADDLGMTVIRQDGTRTPADLCNEILKPV